MLHTKNSISKKIILYVILFSSAITFLSSAFQLYENFDDEVSIIELRLNDILKFYAHSVTTTLWTANYEDLKVNLKGIIKIPDIVYVSVIVDDEINVSLGKTQTERVIELNKQIKYLYRGQNLVLGTFHLQASLDSAYQHVIDQIIRILINNGIKTFFVAFFILYTFNLLVTRHLNRIANFTRNLDYEKLDSILVLDRKKTEYPDELDDVVKAISTLQENILDFVKKVELSESKVLLLLNSTAEAIYGVDTDGACTFINTSCLKMLGYGHESELLGKNMHELIHYNYANGKFYPVKDCLIYKAFLSGKSSHCIDEVLWRKNASSFPVEYWSYPIYQDNKITGAVVTFMDITERLSAETELKIHKENLNELVIERTIELENSNKALESFSYSVSHDLRTPLRAINGFSQLLIEDYGDKLNNQARNYFSRITNAVTSMSMLIDDLLSLASVSKKELRIVEVDIEKIIKHIFDKLHYEYPERKIEIKIDVDCMLCDKNLITIVWENLIQNAWKYTGKTEDASIEIGVIQGVNKTLYIKDNGIGFDMKYVDKIFIPFQRLHKKEEFEGTGIGLATVSRIVSRHGGSIWAESNPGIGTTMFICI